MAKKLNVKEKFGDYLLDVSKYVLTAVMITTFVNDVAVESHLIYAVGILIVLSTLLLGLFYYSKI